MALLAVSVPLHRLAEPGIAAILANWTGGRERLASGLVSLGMPARITDEAAIAVMIAAGLKPLEVYRGAMHAWRRRRLRGVLNNFWQVVSRRAFTHNITRRERPDRQQPLRPRLRGLRVVADHAGQVYAGQVYAGQVCAGQVCAGQSSEGQVCVGQVCAGQVCAGQV